MAKELMGSSLVELEHPIKIALKCYENYANNGLRFDLDNACLLELTPDKPNSARSTTTVSYKDEPIGNLYVIAFKPGDGTGDENSYKLSDLVTAPYPRSPRVVPRSKNGVHSEAHLTLVYHEIGNVHADPMLFKGSFDLLGLEGKRIIKIGELGHPKYDNKNEVVTTLTVGYRRGGERFGDPHAVYSSVENAIQICGFFAISDAVHQKYPYILDDLTPRLPINLII